MDIKEKMMKMKEEVDGMKKKMSEMTDMKEKEVMMVKIKDMEEKMSEMKKNKIDAETIIHSGIGFDKNTVSFEVNEGKMFLKELVYEGNYVHPEDSSVKIDITVEKMQEWVRNFHKKLIDIPFVPLTHTGDPMKNTGDIIDIYVGPSTSQPGKMALFGKLLIKIKEVAEKIGKTILGDSIGVVKVYSNETGELLGEALEHVALTNRPYIQNLSGFQELAKSIKMQYVFERESVKDKSPTEGKDMADLIQLEKELAEIKKAREEDAKKFAASEAIRMELEKSKVELENTNKQLEVAKFEAEVTSSIEKLVLEGKVLPAEKDSKISLAKKLGSANATEFIADLAKASPRIKLGGQGLKQEEGVPAHAPKASELAELMKGAFSFRLSKDEVIAGLDAWMDKAKAAEFKFEKDVQVVNLENMK